MIHLCYKKYEWKITEGAHKYFTDKTGLDLLIVFGDYIEASFKTDGVNLIQRMQIYGKLYTREVVNYALHSIISSINPDVELKEIEDATYRVSWQLSDRPDDLSEPWCVVMYHTALEINDYMNKNLPKKKADI
tara:strand:- start:55 stop:453 length:399 start_codon:yes stop_codon:yes gene_type:complete